MKKIILLALLLVVTGALFWIMPTYFGQHLSIQFRPETDKETPQLQEGEPSGTEKPSTKKVITAITAIREKDKAFQLSAQATSSLKIKSGFVQGTLGKFRVPADSLVEFQEYTAVYTVTDGWYKLVPVVLLARQDNHILVFSPNLKLGQKIVVSGVPLLHVADLEINSQSE